MKHLFRLLLIVLFFTSCDPAQRIARIVKRHPELVKSDSVKKEISVAIPPLDINKSIPLSKDTAALFAVVDNFKKVLGDSATESLKDQIRIIRIKSKALKDTATFIQDSITVKVWEIDGKLYFTIHKPVTHVKTVVPVVINNLTVEKVLTWKQRVKLWLFENWWWILIIVSAIVLAFRKVIGGYISMVFPFLRK